MEVDPSRKVELVLRLVARYFSIFARLSISDGSLVDERILVNHHNVRAGNPPFSSSPALHTSKMYSNTSSLLTLSQIYSDLPFFKFFSQLPGVRTGVMREPFVGKTFLFEMTSLPTYSKDI